MSAFIIAKETMDHVVTAIDMAFSKSNRFGEVPLHDLDNLGRKLFAMNLDAVSQRYPGESKNTLPGPVDTTNIHDGYCHTIRVDTNKVKGLKAVCCLHYQANEGNVPETSELYRALADLAHNMSMEIVSEMPAWRTAKTWE